MTAAIIILSALCVGLLGLLVAVFSALSRKIVSLQDALEITRSRLSANNHKNSALLSRAFALLKEERSNCKTTRRSSWLVEIGELENDWRNG